MDVRVDPGRDDETRWWIHVDPDMRMVELAAIVAALGLPLTAEFIDKGPAGKRGVVLRPVGPGSPPPTAQQLRDILQHGVTSLPTIQLRACRGSQG